jgi:ATP-binding cassette subfamily B protein
MNSGVNRAPLHKLQRWWLQRRRQQLPCVRQFDQEDCGAACLATVARAHGGALSLGRARELVGTGACGTTLLGLKRGAEQLGFHARAARADAAMLERLEELPRPLICHWQGNHWVVLHGTEQGRLLVADPAVGMRELSPAAFLAGWQNGIVLLLEPDPARFQQELQRPEGGAEPALGLELVLRFVRPFRHLLLQVLALNLLIGLLALGMPLLMQVLTDDVLIRGDHAMLASLSAGLMVLFVLRGGLSWMQGLMVSHFAQKLQLQMVLHYGQRLLQLPLSYFESHRSGEVVSRIADIQRLNGLIAQAMVGIPSQLCIALVSLLLMLSYNRSLTAAALVCYASVIVCNLAFLPALQRRSRQLIVRSAENQGYLVELFRGAVLLKTTEATPQAWQELQRNVGRLARTEWASQQLTLKESTATTLLGHISSIALLWYGSSFVMQQHLSIGQLLAFNGLGANILGFLAGLSAVSQEGITSAVVLRRLSDVLERTPEGHGQEHRHDVSLSPQADLNCNDITWHHPGRRPLLQHFTMHIPGGMTTALIGESGCGKSSITRLLAGIHALQEGTIHYGPFSSTDLSLPSLRRQVVLVPQDSHLFNRSIFDNFAFTHPGVDLTAVIEACRIAMADGFIRELPDGYGTVLGEFGANLSGGQRQRLALARALIHNPPVLILDESTSALDPVLEQQLMDQVLEHRRGRTTILVSHRPSVILRADWIVYLERGQVKQQGRATSLRDCAQVAPFLAEAVR